MSFIVATFYHFVELSNYYDMKDEIKSLCDDFELKGTILLAEEGINATISGRRNAIDKTFDFLRSDFRLKDFTWKESIAEYQPFSKMKVKLKKEIVNLGVSNLDISLRGKLIDPEYWDDFISQPEVLVIDTRNEYEVKLGKFKNAINPHIQRFCEFPKWVESFFSYSDPEKKKHIRIAMYCTGGIRCEKSTAYMKNLGFNYVYHLKGGVFSYLESTNNKSGNWEGECFVFDDRVAINSSLVPTNKIKCVFCSSQVLAGELKSASRGQVVCYACRAKN